MDPDLQQLLESMKAESSSRLVILVKCQQWNRLHFDLSGSVRLFSGIWLAKKLQVKLTGRRRWTLFFFGLTCIFSTLAESAFISGVLVTRYFEVTLPVSTDVTAGRAALPLTDLRVALSPCRSNWALPFDLKNMYILRFLNSELSVGPWTRHRRISSCSQQLQFVELESEGGGVRSRLRDSLCPDRSQLIRWDRCVRGAWRSLSADFSCLWNFRGLNRAGGKPNSCVTSDPFKQTLIKVLAGSSMWLLKRQSIDRSAMGSRAAVFKTRRKRLAQLREMSTGPWTPPP